MKHNPIESQVSKGNSDSPTYPEPEILATKGRGLKICLIVSFLFFIIIATVLVTLYFTIFKPKNPDIFVHPVDLDNFQLLSPNSTNAPLGMVITIVNPNYGSFSYSNSTGYVKYRDTIIAEVPLVSNSVPARSTVNVSTSAGVMTGKLLGNVDFLSDIEDMVFNLTSMATLPGKASVLNIFKLKATVYISCDMSFNISAIEADSSCTSKIDL
ncbi:uncharacterized protein LOC113859717 [Abrus precatorius]|uniref:Uncharacterized protein LOC113859717 n=1 Tax=Abrus precatorius TaxID=3816 RepID=A0A8B8KXY5_ABRPR|nr:uncharacterized protein LOC113859717 [Abrus precatorius]